MRKGGTESGEEEEEHKERDLEHKLYFYMHAGHTVRKY